MEAAEDVVQARCRRVVGRAKAVVVVTTLCRREGERVGGGVGDGDANGGGNGGGGGSGGGNDTEMSKCASGRVCG